MLRSAIRLMHVVARSNAHRPVRGCCLYSTDAVSAQVPPELQRFARVAVVGPANAGKSSLVNTLLGSKA
jgi:ribosome biogenesis GTPase A